MHLALRAPAIWYLAALHGGDFNVAGMTLPGVPVVVAGHSDRVAWGYTNAMVDDVDFFVEQVDSANPDRYRTPHRLGGDDGPPGDDPGQGRRAASSTTCGPRGTARCSATRRSVAASRVLAMQWTAYAPSTEVVALLGMNTAKQRGGVHDRAARLQQPAPERDLRRPRGAVRLLDGRPRPHPPRRRRHPAPAGVDGRRRTGRGG